MNNINEGQTYNNEINLQKEIEEFLSYLVENSSIKEVPEIKLIDNDINNASTIFGKTAFFDPNNNSITLYTEGRHVSDILKSLAHEYLHFLQNLEGRLNNITTDNITEDDNLAELEREAYEYSGIMFRKYKDSKKIKKLQNDVFPSRKKETHDYLSKALYEIKLNPQNSAKINGDEKDGSFVVGDFKYIYRIYEMNMEDMGEEYVNKKFYNIYFHPEEYKESKPLNNTSPSNYIKILNTMYNIILRFSNKYKPDYIGISSLDNNSSKNYHSLYNELTKNHPLPGYQRKNSNLEFETSDNIKGRFIVLKKKESNIQEVCHIKSGDDPYNLNQFMREATQELVLDNPKYKIYIDLDEVLVAFDDSFKEIFGESPSSYEKKHGRAELIFKIEQQNVDFWSKLKWARDAMPLWEYIKKYSPTVITAPFGKVSEIGKRKWVNYNLGTNVPIIFAKAEQKYKYSGINKILIDDITSTIYKWIDGGGIGIHHISTFDTLNKLKKLGL